MAAALALLAAAVGVADVVGGRGAGRVGGGSRSDGDSTGAPGGVLRVGVTPLPSLDPAQARSLEQLLVVDQLFDSLTAPDPRTLEPRPSLAARWQASPDQRQWDFFLRPGARFSNGRAVTAADVKFSLERVVRPGSGSPGADLLQAVTGYGDFRVRRTAPGLAGVTAPAPDRVHISLDQAWSVLPSVLASPVFGVVARESVGGPPPGTMAAAPATSGPFRVRGERGQVLSLVPSEGSPARVAGVDFVQFDDMSAAYRAFARGRVDWAQVPSEEVQAPTPRNGDAALRPYLAQVFYGFNMRSPKLADPRFREAVVRAVDRRAVATAVYQGIVRPSDNVVLEGVPGYQRGACRRCGHDPARARSLVQEAFRGRTPPELGIDYDQDQSQEAVAKAIQVSLQEVGIPAVLRPKPFREYDEFTLSGRQELFRLGWIAPYPSPDAFLGPLFETRSPNNLTGFSNPAVDGLLRAARAEGNAARRTQLYREAERTVLDQVPVLPLAQFQLHSVVSERVRNLRTTSLGTFDASVVSLAGD